ncbi:MAG TPA: family 20 glycosylhydrolase [Steroidobacteraceae bacterium]|nr:family 20 glycosylhydrolase [Steroidobacteraceae bacterium]
MKTRRRVLWLFFLLAIATCALAENPAAPTLNVVPRPASVESRAGTFLLTGDTRILAADEESRRIARLFNDFLLEQHGLQLQITGARPGNRNYISFSQAGSKGLPEEGYRLVIGPGDIRVTGQAAGLFYGMQTLTQLLPPEIKPAIELPALEITDSPRFGYRGLLLDVGRHFFSVAHIKKLLDLAAQYKINRFHWHLTDDQAWRIEIKKYPQLTAVGSYVDDTSPGGRYYTQEQIKDLVAYAQARFITVIPEIEMPGHAGAAIAAYPQLACTQGVGANVLCPSEATFTFLRDVLTEVAALFPGPYIHIGSDEVDKIWWRQSAEAQAIIKREGLKNEEELQSYFVRRIEQFLAAAGKRTIGWDEILEGGLAPNAIVMSWRGEGGGIEAVRQKHQAIMTPSEYAYFDYYQGDPAREPLAIGGFVPLEKAYSYEPIPQALQGQEREYILGAQASVWTEYISTPEHLEYMVFPRLLALSEAVWSPAAVRDYRDFQRRLPYQLQRLDKQDVRFRIPEPAGLQDFYTATADHTRVELHSFIPGSRVYYTLDGSEPTADSSLYEIPFQVALQPEQKKSLNLVVVTPAGRSSRVYGATFQRRSYRDASTLTDAQPGLRFARFEGTFATVQSFEHGTPAGTGIANSFDLQQFGRSFNYGIRLAGYLKVAADGYYQFAVESDDGSLLQIDDEVVVDNDGNHASRMITGHIPLRQGLHKIKVLYFQSEGNAELRVRWGAAGAELQPLPESALYH